MNDNYEPGLLSQAGAALLWIAAGLMFAGLALFSYVGSPP